MTQFVLAIIISIVVLVFLIVKLNVHPVISLFVGGMLCGSILGNSPLTTHHHHCQRLRFHSGQHRYDHHLWFYHRLLHP